MARNDAAPSVDDRIEIDSATPPQSVAVAAMMRVAFYLLLPLAHALCTTTPRLRGLPSSPEDMMTRCAAAVSRAAEAGIMRQSVKVVVPDDTRTYKVFGAVPIQGSRSRPHSS